MDHHKAWLQKLYKQYEHKQIPTEFEYFSHVTDREVNLNEVIYRTAKELNFEELWLERYPPLLQRQHGFVLN